MAHKRNDSDSRAALPPALAALTPEAIEQGIAQHEAIEQHRKADIQREQAAEARFAEQLVAWVESETAPAHKAPGIRPAGARRESRARRPARRRTSSTRAGSDDDPPGEPPGPALRLAPPPKATYTYAVLDADQRDDGRTP